MSLSVGACARSSRRAYHKKESRWRLCRTQNEENGAVNAAELLWAVCGF
jgi:hypothetical protein